ncbi:Lipase 1 precursor [Pseudovibrio axinellae]|uniref:Lipase 1 n=1 Tax=Pseudovibrio axinellae TaxID=989403 RepID=A0A165T097_9HYPH|nr:alpha/beta hydrolase [Pseudovibrio axinellae]KZL05117.1 Lipase 1 precursor [Pseudovibrio axinellae]SER48837.1 Pimeloyl-ACP methyl ester carboxylesterase [Pseudovibrio axinellae]
MKKIFIYLFSFLFLLVALGLLANRFWPIQTAKAMLSTYIASAGLKAKQVETSIGQLNYLEGGEGETVVLLHGIFARKEHWIKFSRQLTDKYRVIIPDLPGFADNPILGDGQYHLDTQAKNLVKLLDALKLDQFHLAANSMGGQISGTLSLQMPERIKSISFIGSPLGVRGPQESDFEIAVAKGEMPLVVDSLEAYKKRNTYLFPKKPFVPPPIENLWRSAEISRGDVNRRIWHEVRNSIEQPLQEMAPMITQPSLVVWCKEDRIFDPSGAEVLTEALPNAALVWLEKCGHVPMLDKPKSAGLALRRFLESH